MPAARTFVALTASAVLALVAGESAAQGGSWPSRPIRFVVPLPPGGSPDYLSRLLAERMQPVLGQPLVVENKPGAGGNIAREFVAKQPADGYTILMSESSHVMAAGIGAKLPYDPVKDFQPISLAATIPFGQGVSRLRKIGAATPDLRNRGRRRAPPLRGRAAACHDRNQRRARALQGIGGDHPCASDR